jgi:hypothetical protein
MVEVFGMKANLGCVGITIGFLLSAELAIPENDTTEITKADKRDIIFLIFSPFLNIKMIKYVTI